MDISSDVRLALMLRFLGCSSMREESLLEKKGARRPLLCWTKIAINMYSRRLAFFAPSPSLIGVTLVSYITFEGVITFP
jgi:hypothetical protein